MTDSVTEVCFSAKRVKKLEGNLGELSEEKLFKLDLEGQARFTTLTRKRGYFRQQKLLP